MHEAPATSAIASLGVHRSLHAPEYSFHWEGKFAERLRVSQRPARPAVMHRSSLRVARAFHAQIESGAIRACVYVTQAELWGRPTARAEAGPREGYVWRSASSGRIAPTTPGDLPHSEI